MRDTLNKDGASRTRDAPSRPSELRARQPSQVYFIARERLVVHSWCPLEPLFRHALTSNASFEIHIRCRQMDTQPGIEQMHRRHGRQPSKFRTSDLRRICSTTWISRPGQGLKGPDPIQNSRIARTDDAHLQTQPLWLPAHVLAKSRKRRRRRSLRPRPP